MKRTYLFTIIIAIMTSTMINAQDNTIKSTWKNPVDGMKFVFIPPGEMEFEIPNLKSDTEKKTIIKTISFSRGFWMAQTEVTVQQFRNCVEQTGYVTDAEAANQKFSWKSAGFKQASNHPVVWLSFDDALHYAQWAGVDLPTQAEWLYAARAGAKTRFYWGDELDDRYVWHRGNTEGLSTQPVARKKANDWRLYDMVGNAWEYCKAEGGCFALMGGAWTRCPMYKLRQGSVYYPFDDILKPRLHICDPNPNYVPYPYDDDRGFRCIRRMKVQESD